MAKSRPINPADLYERAETVAHAAAVGRSKKDSYSLNDILNDEHLWQDIFRTAFLSVIPLHATLGGCVRALKNHDVTAEDVGDVGDVQDSHATPLEQADRAMARQWLAAAVHSNLDRDQQQLMIVDYVVAQGWETHATRLPALMHAVVAMSRAALTHA